MVQFASSHSFESVCFAGQWPVVSVFVSGGGACCPLGSAFSTCFSSADWLPPADRLALLVTSRLVPNCCQVTRHASLPSIWIRLPWCASPLSCRQLLLCSSRRFERAVHSLCSATRQVDPPATEHGSAQTFLQSTPACNRACTPFILLLHRSSTNLPGSGLFLEQLSSPCLLGRHRGCLHACALDRADASRIVHECAPPGACRVEESERRRTARTTANVDLETAIRAQAASVEADPRLLCLSESRCHRPPPSRRRTPAEHRHSSRRSVIHAGLARLTAVDFRVSPDPNWPHGRLAPRRESIRVPIADPVADLCSLARCLLLGRQTTDRQGSNRS